MAEATTNGEEKEEMEKIFQIVAKKINRHWKWLGRKLKVDNAVIEEVEGDFRGQSEQAFQVLMRWFQMNGQNATKEVLYVALREIGFQSVVDIVDPNFWSRNKIPPKKERPDTPKSLTKKEESNEDRRISPEKPPSSPRNGYSWHLLEWFEKEVKQMFEDCIDNLTPDTDRFLLVSKLKMAQHVMELNTILMRFSRMFHDEVIRKSCTIRYEQTDQLIRLILNTMAKHDESKKTRSHRTRSASERIPRRKSMVTLQPRSGTFSSGLSTISSPISTSRQCLFGKESSSGFPNQICEEVFAEYEQTEPCQGPLPRCDSCGSCLSFEVKQDSREMNEMNPVDENWNEDYRSAGLISQETSNDNDDKENQQTIS
ncbi:uncharacterized protein LOC114532730 [Dendronephthya gigantea]|uniref:uncharacterized protein LOC114532730 n=1 Tax=Dendronephthya gigantea TaxID=151771 RepID=UPI00106AC078|nr:uncharacterized protein LOC114532730 [Dendronephthya gigantea]